MSLSGKLTTMPLPDLLQWLATAGKTGTLRVERDHLAKWIIFRAGRVVGCSSDCPPERLGQQLIAREKISEIQLREALARQEGCDEPLGEILIGLGLVERSDLSDLLEAQAEETIYSLFDWDEAVFTYTDGEVDTDARMPVDLQVEDILLRGLKRYDEMKRVRQVFHDPGIVLRYTEVPPGPEIFKNKMARAMYSTIDGDRTIADILLHVHGSEYIVYKFLFELHRNGYVEIAELREIDASRPAPAAHASPASPAGPAAGGGTATLAAPSTGTSVSLDADLASASEAMDRGEYEPALEILDRLYREHPNDDALRRLTAEAEATYLEHAYDTHVPPHKVPVLTRPVSELAAEAMSPHDFFLLSRIDGSWDVKSIIQVSPLREIDAVRTLKRMYDAGVVKLLDP